MKIPLLIDFDGTIRIGNRPVEDANNFLSYVKEKEIPAFIISNSTLKTSEDILSFLKENNLPIIAAMTAADAALSYVKDNYTRISVYCIDSIRKKFEASGSCRIDDNKPEAVVIGDIGDKWSYKIMNDIFSKVYNNADIIAMHKNKFWMPDGKTLALDAGTFISAIEYATSKEAILIGKPSPIYFRTAIKLLGYSTDSQFLMIGDDIETDIIGSQQMGGKGILVYTGKTKYPLPENFLPKPDYEAKSLTEVKNILEKFYN
jgi:HAD superfamily hydrolase (TIGR01458 family)